MPGKKIEIDEDTFNQFQNAVGLLQKLNGTPEARKHLEKSLKVLNPQLETEEDAAARIAQPYVERIAAAEKAVTDLRESLAAEKAAAATAAEEARTAGALGWLDAQDYTEEGKAAIKKIMVDEKIPNVEAAAALFEKRTPKPVVIAGANYESDAWNLRGDPEDKNLKSLFENEDQWADREAAITLNAIRKDAARAAAA